MIHGILPVQFTCLTVFPHNLSPTFLWSTSWPGTPTPYISSLNHCLFSQHIPIPSQPRLCRLIPFSLSTPYLRLYCSLIPHIHQTIIISAHWSATWFSFLTCQVSFPCNILLRTQLLYNLPLTINDISLLVSSGTNCLNLFHPIWILISTAASASPSTLNMSPK